jgi:outer membrane protein insertion porin family
MAYYPFGPVNQTGTPTGEPRPFNRSEWDAATEKVQNLYANNGYIYASVVPEETRRTGPDGKPYLDLGWTIREGSPATINKIQILGNDVTHGRVIREAIVMLPGDLFSRERLIRSYQNVSNLGFFQQPMPAPDVKPTENGVDVDVVFRVEERRTGNINFGASLGPGGAEPVRAREARSAPVAVRQEHQRLHPELHRSQHPGEPDFGHGVAVR